ncbi:MAG: hypothetical protein ACE5J4_00885 [Candidatus Aenigmatarchaeota archaeon]
MEKLKIPKLTKMDKIAIIILIIFVILVTIPIYLPKGECEVTRPRYKCASFKDVMIENCQYWAQYDCDTSSDISLVQIEWYIKNMCEFQSKKQILDCSNLKLACNQITGSQICPIEEVGSIL